MGVGGTGASTTSVVHGKVLDGSRIRAGHSHGGTGLSLTPIALSLTQNHSILLFTNQEETLERRRGIPLGAGILLVVVDGMVELN